jgi:hypothetical protein
VAKNSKPACAMNLRLDDFKAADLPFMPWDGCDPIPILPESGWRCDSGSMLSQGDPQNAQDTCSPGVHKMPIPGTIRMTSSIPREGVTGGYQWQKKDMK